MFGFNWPDSKEADEEVLYQHTNRNAWIYCFSLIKLSEKKSAEVKIAQHGSSMRYCLRFWIRNSLP